MLPTSVFAIAALTLAACATPSEQASAAPPARDCFQSSSVRGFNMLDNRHVNVSVGANRDYVLTTGWDAHDLDWSHAIALRSTTGFICTGNGLGVEIIGGNPQQRHVIDSIVRAPPRAARAS